MRAHFLISLLVCASRALSAQSDVYIGLDLKPIYGTSAIAYGNGTVIGIARVEGNNHYQHTMKKISLQSSTHKAYATQNLPN